MTANTVKEFYKNRAEFGSDRQKNARASSDQLTKTELKLLNLIAHGKTNSELSDIFNFSEYTIIVYREVICKKMQATNITQATIKAARQGMVEI